MLQLVFNSLGFEVAAFSSSELVQSFCSGGADGEGPQIF
jgi:hypothetical protein